MKWLYEPSIIAFIQFVIASFFVLISQLGSTIVGCFKNSTDCVLNLTTAIVFFILVSIVFGVIWIISYATQERRTKRMAQLLICAEGGIGVLGLFSLKLNLHAQKPNIFGLLAGAFVVVFAGWLVFLAFRIMRAGGGRVVTNQKRRRRRLHES